MRYEAGEVQIMLPHGQTLSEQQEYPWVTEDGQELPQVLCIEDKKNDKSRFWLSLLQFFWK